MRSFHLANVCCRSKKPPSCQLRCFYAVYSTKLQHNLDMPRLFEKFNAAKRKISLIQLSNSLFLVPLLPCLQYSASYFCIQVLESFVEDRADYPLKTPWVQQKSSQTKNRIFYPHYNDYHSICPFDRWRILVLYFLGFSKRNTSCHNCTKSRNGDQSNNAVYFGWWSATNSAMRRRLWRSRYFQNSNDVANRFFR